MKLRIHAIIIVISFIIVPVLISCGGSGNDEDLALLAAGEAQVILNLKMPGDEITASNSIIDRIMRLFTSDAVAQSSPAAIFYISVTVSGPGIVPYTAYYYPASQVAINVLQGNNRTITATAHVMPGDPSPVTSFTGTTTVDITAGEKAAASTTLVASGSKLVIPDPYGTPTENKRIVQIDDISGKGWVARDYTFFGYADSSLFNPCDIDFDARGRIYILSDINTAGGPKIVRIDNINDSSYDIVVSDTGAGTGTLSCIAIDRIRNIVYYATNNSLYKCNYDGTGESPLSLSGYRNIYGMTVDQSTGLLYIVCEFTSSPFPDRILKYDPVAENIINYAETNLATPWDVTIMDSKIFVTNHYASSGYAILQFNTDLELTGNYGDINPNEDNYDQGKFYGPKRFIGIRNDQLVIADDMSRDKLVSMTDILGSNWRTYGTTGSGVGQFHFLGSC